MGNSSSHEEDHKAVGGFTQQNQADEAASAMFEGRGLGTRIQLSLRCRDLANMDQGSDNLSDPFIVVLIREMDGIVRELGRTEVICNTLSPSFVKVIPLTYKFEEVQHLVFRVFDVDTFAPGFDNSNTSRLDLSKQDFIGEAECDLASIMGRHGQTHTLTLTSRGAQGSRGSLIVTGEELAHQNATVRFKLSAEDVPKVSMFSAPYPFLVVERLKEAFGGVETSPCYKTEVSKRNYKPSWNAFDIGVQSLCNANFSQPIRFKVFSWDKNVTLDELLRKRSGAYPLVAPGRNGRDAGSLVVESVELVARPSFLDYIKGGCEIAFTVAVDFTARYLSYGDTVVSVSHSNGDCSDPRSLHYINPYSNAGMDNNAYGQAILAVGTTLEYYDADKSFPVYGFGGRVGNYVSHCFALNGNDAAAEVQGVQGVLGVYQQAIRTYQLAGPTFFSEIIQRVSADAVHCTPQSQKYHVLLIITDGIINDFDNTISSIIAASSLPLSILIVGVGNADFGPMDVLDGDAERLRNASGVAVRDIVQFVPLRDFILPNGVVDRVSLSRALLDEIPGQLLSYMQLRGIPPRSLTSAPPL